MKIVVIGAGISGLTFAAAMQKLARDGVELSVYERDASADSRQQGYAIGLDDEHALPVLESLNLYDNLVNHADSKKISNFVFHNQQGKELLSSLKISKKKIAYRVQRQIIKATLIQAIGNTPIHYGHQAIRFTQRDNSVLVEFANGEHVIADYVIACDGASSKIRQILIDDEKNYLGLASISGLSSTTANPECLDGGYYMGLGDEGASVFIYRQPDGIYYSYTFPAKDPASLKEKQQQDLLHFVQDKAQHWNPLVQDIVQTTRESTVNIRFYYDRQPLNKMRYDRLWLIGDSAHTMSPFRGLGANLAMVSAYELASLMANLSEDSDKNELAMKKLEKKLLKNGKKAILQSRKSAKNLHVNNKIAVALRDSKFWFFRCLLKFA